MIVSRHFAYKIRVLEKGMYCMETQVGKSFLLIFWDGALNFLQS